MSPRSIPKKDLKNKVFGRLRVISYIGNSSWSCLCTCGTVVNVLTGNLNSGSTISCGCASGRNLSDKERFFKHIDKQKDGCWVWTGHRTSDGYGCFRVNQKPTRANRASYVMFNGVLSQKEVVRHTCDNPLCVNPDHLLKGTHADNVNDKVMRNRAPSILNQSQVLEIKELLIKNDIPISEIAAIYGVKSNTIYDIKNNKTWKHIQANAIKEGRMSINDYVHGK